MKTAILHTVNCGLYLCHKETAILIDGLHSGGFDGWSYMPREIVDQAKTHSGIFQHLSGLLFTHMHADHFDADMLECALYTALQPAVYGPGLEQTNVTVKAGVDGTECFSIGSWDITALPTMHDGDPASEQTGPLDHRAFLLANPEEVFFVAGDARLTDVLTDEIQQHLSHPPDAVFLNFLQITVPANLDFIRKISPKRIFLYHLPFQDQDLFCYHKMTDRNIRRLPQDISPVEKLPSMSWVDGRFPDWIR